MVRVAFLWKQAAEIRRQLFASLPWHERLAHLLTVLASQDNDYARIMAVVFGLHKTKGMPPVPFVAGPHKGQTIPAEDVDWSQVKNPMWIHHDYLPEVSRAARGFILKKFRNPSIVEPAMNTFAAKFHSGHSHFENGLSLEKAISYTLRGLTNAAIDVINSETQKDENKERVRSLTDLEEPGEEKQRHDVVDEDSLEDLEDKLAPSAWHFGALNHALKAIHPDVPLFLDLVYRDGYNQAEIIREGMLPHPYSYKGGQPTKTPMTIQLWSTSVTPKIQATLEKYLKPQAGRSVHVPAV